MDQPQHISALLVEDDRPLAELTAEYLRGHGVEVRVVHNGTDALQVARKEHFDVLLLDLMLPGVDGITLCQKIRVDSDVPVIMLTARGEEADRVLGLELGADDYLVKPFSPRELLARIRARLRRQRSPRAQVIRAGGLVLDPDAMRALLDGKPITLTAFEFALLRALAARPGRVLAREQLLDLAHGLGADSFDRAIDVHISRLRQKLGDSVREPRFIRTVRGSGYMFCEQHDAP